MTAVAGRASWTLAALLSAFCLSSIVHQPAGWPPLALLGALALVAALRPYEGLLLFTGLAPLATMIFVIIRTGEVGVHYHEAMALAFLGGFAIRRVIAPRPAALPPWLYACTLTLLALVIASGMVTTAILVAEEAGYQPLELLQTLITREYLVSSNTVTTAGLFAEGLLLMLAVAEVTGEDPRRRRALARMLVIGAAAAAALNIVRIIALALSRGGGWSTFLGLLATLRVNVHFQDLNAAGSYFAMALFIALGLIRDSRSLALVCGCLTAIGLWISGSRTALLAMLIAMMLAGVSLLWRANRRSLAVGTVGILAAATLALAISYPRERNSPAHIAWDIRSSLARGAVDMTASAPLFGVGVGRYYVLSVPYTLKQYVAPRENAHNYYLQLLAELGIPGLLLFSSVILLALREGVRTAPASLLSTGLTAGVTTYLVTCITGHPLLVAGAAYPFWIALAMTAAQRSDPLEPRSRASVFLVAAVVMIAASLPFRISQAKQEANLENASAGFSLWQRQPDGSRYRFAGGRSTFYAPAAATAVRIPLRAGSVASSPVEVQISVDDRKADRIIVEPGAEWSTVRLILPRRSSGRFTRIDLEAFVRGAPRPADAKLPDTNGLLMVGRPEYDFPATTVR